MSQTETTRAGFRAAIVAIAPAALLAGFFYHPYFENVTDSGATAAAAAADTTRWGIAHLTIAVGYGLIAVAFLAIHTYLREASQQRWSGPALACIIVGSVMFAVLVGMEFVPLTAAETGADAEALQAELRPWFFPILVTGAVSFALGALGFAMGIVRSRVLSPRLTWLVALSLAVMAAVRFIPLPIAPLVMTVAGVVALWPLAYKMWKAPEASLAGQRRWVPAT